MLDAFPTLKSGRPDIMQLNDDMTVQINQTAPKAQSDRAIIDQYADMSVSMSDGLGARLGAIYKAARDAGQLPKTAALLNKENGLVGRGGSTGPAKNHYANPRPYVRFPSASSTATSPAATRGPGRTAPTRAATRRRRSGRASRSRRCCRSSPRRSSPARPTPGTTAS